jgi:hypothetical protein
MKIVQVFTVILVLILSASISYATFIVDTTPTWDGCSMGTFTANALIGQTFAVNPSDTRLDYFAVYVNDDIEYMTLNFHVMEWSISQLKVVGPILYSSQPKSTSNNAGNDGWEKIVFETGGIELDPLKAYIAMISVPSDENSRGWLGCVADMYSGEFAYTSGTMDNIYTVNWTTDYPSNNCEMACEIGFNVPEPATILLLGFGGFILKSTRNRKKVKGIEIW